MTMHLPASLTTASARLPQTYEAAKTALANCESIDECQTWANKAEALASYARMADDDVLFKFARRIQARAVRRCGELLKQFDARGDHRKNDGADISSRREVGTQAGMSERQQVTAVRVANVPAEQFEGVEGDDPPTVTKLADMGTRHRAPAPPEGFAEATKLLGTVRRFAEFCQEHNPQRVAQGVMPTETPRLREMVASIDGWLDQFVVSLKE